MTSCPICKKRLFPIERVTARHVPATVPEGADDRLYANTYRYEIVQCEREHVMFRTDKGIFGTPPGMRISPLTK